MSHSPGKLFTALPAVYLLINVSFAGKAENWAEANDLTCLQTAFQTH